MENIKITDLEVHTEMIVQHVRNGKFLKGVSQKKRNEGRRGKWLHLPASISHSLLST